MHRRGEPLDPTIVAADPRVHRLRRCGRCGDVMACSGLTEHVVNSGYAGRAYSYRCNACGYVLDDLDLTRLSLYLGVVAIAGPFGVFLAKGSVAMAARGMDARPGGNDPAALNLLATVMLLGAIPLLLGTGFILRRVLADWIARHRSPVIAAPCG